MSYHKKFQVEPGEKVHLNKIDPAYTGQHESHETALPKIEKHIARMEKLQYLLYADADKSLLIVLQALDAAGKDGVVSHNSLTGFSPSNANAIPAINASTSKNTR